MKIKEIVGLLGAKSINIPDENANISCGYCCDFLSNAMIKAPEGCAWLTVMNNQNVAAVASLAKVGLVVLCEGVSPDSLLLVKAKAEQIAIISTYLTEFEAATKLFLLDKI